MKDRKQIVALGAVLGKGEEISLSVDHKIKGQLPSISEEINRKRFVNRESGIVNLFFFPTAEKQLLLKCLAVGD